MLNFKKLLLLIFILSSQIGYGQILWDCDSSYHPVKKIYSKVNSTFIFNINDGVISNILVKIKDKSFVYEIDLWKEDSAGVSFLDKKRNFLSVDQVDEFIVYNEIGYYNCIITKK